MSSSVPFRAAPDSATEPVVAAHEDLLDECLEKTAFLLYEASLGTQDEIASALREARKSHADGHPRDVIEALARGHGHDEEHIGEAIGELATKLAMMMPSPIPAIPFANKLIAPSSFYEMFDQLHKLGGRLLSPVIYAEDTDAIGVASINPVAADLFGQEITRSVFRRFGIRPFITVVRLDYENWSFLTRKHFGL